MFDHINNTLVASALENLKNYNYELDHPSIYRFKFRYYTNDNREKKQKGVSLRLHYYQQDSFLTSWKSAHNALMLEAFGPAS